MLGKRMTVSGSTFDVIMKPFNKDEIASEHVVGSLSDYMVTRYTPMQYSPTVQKEESFYENVSSDSNQVIWGLYIRKGGKKLSKLIGLSSLQIVKPYHMGSTGFMIFNKAYWGKGVASLSHVARIHYAVNHLGLKTIVSTAFTPNMGSIKALQKVGYFITGYKLGDDIRDGKFTHHAELQWINPLYAHMLLDDIPTEEIKNKAWEGVARAQKVLQLAKEIVHY